MHRQVIEARESSFFYCELQVRSALLLAESKGADVTAALAYHALQPFPTRPLEVGLGKVGKVLQYLDKPAPNQTCWKRDRLVKGVSSRGPADLALSTIRPTLLEMH